MASAGPGREDGGMFADINVTPLVDVTLVLLIIFMVATPLIVNNPSLKLELPRAATADETHKTTLALALQRTPAGGAQLFVNGAAGDEQTVRELVPGLLARDPELQATVAADQGIAYGDVVHVVDLVKALGVRKFALDTAPVR